MFTVVKTLATGLVRVRAKLDSLRTTSAERAQTLLRRTHCHDRDVTMTLYVALCSLSSGHAGARRCWPAERYAHRACAPQRRGVLCDYAVTMIVMIRIL